MPRSSPQHALARRALLEDIRTDKRGWAQHGIAVLAITLLGLGVAGSAAVSVSAQHTVAAEPAAKVNSGLSAPIAPSSTGDRDQPVSRSATRSALDAATLNNRAHRRAASLGSTSQLAKSAAHRKAVKAREKKLAAQSASTKRKARQLKARRAAAAKARKSGSHRGRVSLPIRGGYHIAARFGDTGSWSRYHTGLDFAAPVGTPIHAPEAGVVTHAGTGSAGWAGNYVTIKHRGGKSTLYAHMSRVSVRAGESVSGGTVIGAVGLTGRTFGPHVHFELYPAGVKPGDIYHAINPAPWLRGLGLHP